MGRAPCCEKVGLKKGRWTAEEDSLLVDYIRAHGEGAWRSLPKNAGLLRCGKSCRLRWVNYLREDVKRGNISEEEEETILRLQATHGNRRSLLAIHLPGRTDNEIKNYWNAHLSKKAAARATAMPAGTPGESGAPANKDIDVGGGACSGSAVSAVVDEDEDNKDGRSECSVSPRSVRRTRTNKGKEDTKQQVAERPGARTGKKKNDRRRENNHDGDTYAKKSKRMRPDGRHIGSLGNKRKERKQIIAVVIDDVREKKSNGERKKKEMKLGTVATDADVNSTTNKPADPLPTRADSETDLGTTEWFPRLCGIEVRTSFTHVDDGMEVPHVDWLLDVLGHVENKESISVSLLDTIENDDDPPCPIITGAMNPQAGSILKYNDVAGPNESSSWSYGACPSDEMVRKEYTRFELATGSAPATSVDTCVFTGTMSSYEELGVGLLDTVDSNDDPPCLIGDGSMNPQANSILHHLDMNGRNDSSGWTGGASPKEDIFSKNGRLELAAASALATGIHTGVYTSTSSTMSSYAEVGEGRICTGADDGIASPSWDIEEDLWRLELDGLDHAEAQDAQPHGLMQQQPLLSTAIGCGDNLFNDEEYDKPWLFADMFLW